MANKVTDQKSVLVDLTKCVGCGSCTVACKLWNSQSFENPQTGVMENAHGTDVKLDSNTWTTVEHMKVQKDGQEVWRFVKRAVYALLGTGLFFRMFCSCIPSDRTGCCTV